MTTTVESLGIDRLPVADRIDLDQAIWETIAPEMERSPLSEEMQQEVDRRLAAHRANPAAAAPWEEVEAAALARISRS